MKSNLSILFLLMFGFFGVGARECWGAVIFVDNNLSYDCTNGNYAVNNHSCTGSDGNAYSTVQEAVNACATGDKIQIREGTYIESVDIPESKNGSAWTNGNFTTLQSYPGEWAKLEAPDNTSSVLYHATGPSYSGSRPTRHWKIERLEITGGRYGIMFAGGPVWVRYCYIHDNVYPGNCDDLTGGIYLNQARQSIIEYNWITNNQSSGVPSPNCANVTIESDYKDDLDPTNFNPNLCPNRNVIRYNLIEDSQTGVRHKNQQRFGNDTRTPVDVSSGAYKDWGDKWHHNIVRNFGAVGIAPSQDNAQIFNNIVTQDNADSNTIGLQLGWEEGLSSHVPMMFNNVAYNNTVLKVGKSFGQMSGCDKDTQTNTCPQQPHGDPPNEEAHPYVWFYNNISELNASDQGNLKYPVVIAYELPSGEYVNMSHTHFKNNLIHSPQNLSADQVFVRGRADMMTLIAAESLFPHVSDNWQSTTVGLFQGISGADQYKCSGNFVLTGVTTIANGGMGGDHPYLDGVPLPSYIGAANPWDNEWVAGVLNLSDINNLQQGTSEDPDWIEGNNATNDTVAPGNPSGLLVK